MGTGPCLIERWRRRIRCVANLCVVAIPLLVSVICGFPLTGSRVLRPILAKFLCHFSSDPDQSALQVVIPKFFCSKVTCLVCMDRVVVFFAGAFARPAAQAVSAMPKVTSTWQE